MGPADGRLEARIGRVLTLGTYAAVTLLAIGVVAMAATGRNPLDEAPALDLAALPGDLLQLRPAAFLWLGLIGVVATPAARVAVAGLGYLRGGERAMAAVAGLVLLVVAAGVVVGAMAAGRPG